MNILCDIGGTKMRIATENGGVLGDVNIISTPSTYVGSLEALKDNFSSTEKIDKVIVGIAGVVSADKKTIVSGPNLLDWVGKDIALDLSEIFGGGEVVLQNDTALVGLGEALEGAGKGFEIVTYITVSTGVGGVRIVNGVIDKSRYGFEPGHQIIDVDGTQCPECNTLSHEGLGHLDNMISGRALFEKAGKNPKDVSDSDVWNSHARYLAVGLYNTILHWSPDVVVLGGSMITGDPAINIEKVTKNLTELMHAFPEIPVIKMAELGDKGGLIGGSSFV